MTGSVGGSRGLRKGGMFESSESLNCDRQSWSFADDSSMSRETSFLAWSETSVLRDMRSICFTASSNSSPDFPASSRSATFSQRFLSSIPLRRTFRLIGFVARPTGEKR